MKVRAEHVFAALMWVLAAGPGGAHAGGMECGVSAYTFRQGTAFEAIEKAKACGAEVIELFLWQKLSPEHPDVILNPSLSTSTLPRSRTSWMRPASGP